MAAAGTRLANIQTISSKGLQSEVDLLAVEEPLEIRLGYSVNGKRVVRTVSITMRTPGHDLELAAGFLFSEALIQRSSQISSIRNCGPISSGSGQSNVVRVDLTTDTVIDFQRLERHFYTSSSCGVCGKTSLDAVLTTTNAAPLTEDWLVSRDIIHALPEALRNSQSVFDQTGGLHASAIFDSSGALISVREDVGRHNALDKLIGAELMKKSLTLSASILLVSGRASFELVQKAVMARMPIMAAVGAPSSLAVELAQRFNITLLGFVRESRFNIYSAPERIAGTAAIDLS
jgi:FdhD protein